MNELLFISQKYWICRWAWGYGTRCCPYIYQWLSILIVPPLIQTVKICKLLIYTANVLMGNVTLLSKLVSVAGDFSVVWVFHSFVIETKFVSLWTSNYFPISSKTNSEICANLPEQIKYSATRHSSFLIVPHLMSFNHEHQNLYF